jgi:hypothetical protein
MDRTIFRTALLTASFCGASLLTYSFPTTAENLIDIIPDETVDGSVQLTPEYISGTINIGGQNISRMTFMP